MAGDERKPERELADDELTTACQDLGRQIGMSWLGGIELMHQMTGNSTPLPSIVYAAAIVFAHCLVNADGRMCEAEERGEMLVGDEQRIDDFVSTVKGLAAYYREVRDTEGGRNPLTGEQASPPTGKKKGQFDPKVN